MLKKNNEKENPASNPELKINDPFGRLRSSVEHITYDQAKCAWATLLLQQSMERDLPPDRVEDVLKDEFTRVEHDIVVIATNYFIQANHLPTAEKLATLSGHQLAHCVLVLQAYEEQLLVDEPTGEYRKERQRVIVRHERPYIEEDDGYGSMGEFWQSCWGAPKPIYESREVDVPVTKKALKKTHDYQLNYDYTELLDLLQIVHSQKDRLCDEKGILVPNQLHEYLSMYFNQFK